MQTAVPRGAHGGCNRVTWVLEGHWECIYVDASHSLDTVLGVSLLVVSARRLLFARPRVMVRTFHPVLMVCFVSLYTTYVHVM